MKQTHAQLVEAAKKAINAVFSDTSVSQKKTVESLELLSEDIDGMIGAVQCDMEQDNESSAG